MPSPAHPAEGKRVKDIYAPRAFGYQPGLFRAGGEHLSIPQQHIIRTVYHAGGGDLKITSVNRPGQSWHGKAAAIDFGGNDQLEFKVGLRIWKERKWLGGLGLARPPHVPKHLHVDARQYAGAPRERWQKYFIEVKPCIGPGCQEPMTTATLRALAPEYGVEMRNILQRIEDTARETADAARETQEAGKAVMKAAAVAVVGFLVLLALRNR